MDRRVRIEAFLEGDGLAPARDAAVAVDVIRSSTTAVTAVAMGRRCFPVPSLSAALKMASRLQTALLAGEQGGDMPPGFDITNSPAEVARRIDIDRPLILLSSSGTRLMAHLDASSGAYVGCFRNYGRLIQHLAKHHTQVAVLGALSRGEFREEDQMCCAWIAEGLIAEGFQPEDEQTKRMVDRWSGAPRHAFTVSKSVQYLLDSGQRRDLDFVLSHFNDLNAVFELRGGELMRTCAPEPQRPSTQNRYAQMVG